MSLEQVSPSTCVDTSTEVEEEVKEGQGEEDLQERKDYGMVVMEEIGVDGGEEREGEEREREERGGGVGGGEEREGEGEERGGGVGGGKEREGSVDGGEERQVEEREGEVGGEGVDGGEEGEGEGRGGGNGEHEEGEEEKRFTDANLATPTSELPSLEFFDHNLTSSESSGIYLPLLHITIWT